MSKSPFIIFSLHTHIVPFTATECMIGDILMKRGVTPLLIKPLKCTCSLLQHFREWQYDYTIKCVRCDEEERLLQRFTPGWSLSHLSDYADPQDGQQVDEAIARLTPQSLTDFSFNGVPVGRLALHDTVLTHKWDNLDFDVDSEIWHDLRSLVRGLMLCALWMSRAIAHISPRGLLVYNSNYSVNHEVRLLTERAGIPFFSMHGGGSLRHVWETLMLTRGNIDEHRLACCRNWVSGFSERVLSQEEVHLVGEHFGELFQGKNAHAYSAPSGSASCSDLVRSVNPSGDRKVILMALSSSDERFATEQSGVRPIPSEDEYVFPNQLDWLKFFIDRAQQRPDLGFVIRVHPRELPNKRENRTSANALRLKEYLTKLPDNIAVNWPDQNISYYDLLQEIDLVVSSWSTVLLEASLFGCPIVLPRNPISYYDVAADHVCSDRESYWNEVVRAAQGEWSIERAVKTFRWYWMVQHASNIVLRSDQTRQITMREKWHIGFEVVLEKLRKRLNLSLFAKDPQRLIAFWDSPEKISRRQVDVVGEEVIAATLLGDFDPMKDFSQLRQLQELDDSARNVFLEAEKDAVHRELEILFKMIRQKDAKRISKIDAMLERQGALI